ncbi:MAG: RNA polymerase sigma factor [Bacteroidia bacterium]|nr:RNA polymerase sigma factor [Bacteroidia bacterium]
MEARVIDLTEEKMLQGCRNQDRNSQRQLYEKYFEGMSYICMRYLKDRDQVYDLVQEGFIKIFQNIRKFEGKGSLEGWMKRIMINLCLDHLRKINRRLPDVPLEDVYDLEVDEDIVANMEAEYILALLQKLGPMYRTVFNLSVIEGYAHKEISKLLKIRESTSRAYLTAAKKQIRRMLTETIGQRERRAKNG